MIDTIFLWVGFIAVCALIISIALWMMAWFIDKTFQHVRTIKSVFSLYWRFYSTIKELPDGNYSQYRVTWDRDKGEFTNAEGIR